MGRDHEKLLTISIAAYNAGDTLRRTLESACVDAEYMDLAEIIIVDDGSTDNTLSVAEEFRSEHPGSVRIISKANGGYGSTVNAAVRAAEGKYFKLLDGDDTFDAAGLIALIDHLRETDADLVVTPYITERLTGNDPEDGREETLTDIHTDLQTEPVRVEDALIRDGLAMFEICVRTEVLRGSGIRLTEHCFYTDNEFVMAVLLYASDIERLPVPVYRYSLGVPGQSMGITGRRRHAADKIKAAFGVYEIYRGYVYAEGFNRNMTGSRKILADRLISTMAREVYVSGMIMEDPKAYRHVLKEFDSRLRREMTEIFKVTDGSRLVMAARRAGPLTYGILCRRILAAETERTGSYDELMQKPAQRGGLVVASEYVAAACMIIQCRTVWMHLMDYGKTVNRMTWAVMMAAIAIVIICGFREEGRHNNIKRIAVICICMTVYAAIFLIVNPVNPLRIIRCASAVIMMTILIIQDGGRSKATDILLRFRNLMVIIAGLSLFFWIFGSTIHLIKGTGSVYIDWSQTGEYVRIPTLLNIYYETQWTGWSIIPARNTGIFVEAPMAGFCYSVALLIELFIDRKENGHDRNHLMRIMLLTVTLITTLSATSYILLGILVLSKAAKKISGNGISRNMRIVIAAASIVLLAAILYIIWLKIRWGSGSTRLNDFVVGFHAWLAHPFFGGGFESLEYLQEFMPSWRSYDIGFSNSPMEILGQGGIYLGIPYVYSFISSFVKFIRSGNTRGCAFLILFAYLFTFTVVPYQYITFFILILLASADE